MEKKGKLFFFLVLNMNSIPVLSFMLGTMKYCCCHQRKACWGRNALDYLMNPWGFVYVEYKQREQLIDISEFFYCVETFLN